MDAKELKALLKSASELGVSRLKTADIEVEFGAKKEVQRPVSPDAIKSLLESETDPASKLSYEEMLLSSSPAFDLMQEAKEQIEKLTQ